MKIIVIGGGPAGMFCSGLIAENGHDVILIEKNEKLGKKLYITGKGRCNVTNDATREELLNNIVSNPKFAISALSKFSPQDTMNFFETRGVPLKVERGNRVFPVSDKSSDIIKCLEKYINRTGVHVLLNTVVTDLVIENEQIQGVKTKKETIMADAVVVATGGLSYSLTGSTGDGYKWARKTGHNVIELRPGLSALLFQGVSDLSGLSLKNVEASIVINGKVQYSEFGEMLFTHKGVSGPIILSLCSKINKYYVNKKFDNTIMLLIDLKPALDEGTLDQRLIKDLSKNNKMEIKNILSEYMPKALIPFVLKQAKIDLYTVGNAITKEQRNNLINSMKGLKFKVEDIETIEQAIITSGGVDIKEINPKDMQSKIVKGLYFIGEVLDIDALTGGFNIQLALSTAYAMAESIN